MLNIIHNYYDKTVKYLNFKINIRRSLRQHLLTNYVLRETHSLNFYNVKSNNL